jgi:tetratricopeptide (TPR) repeat protein
MRLIYIILAGTLAFSGCSGRLSPRNSKAISKGDTEVKYDYYYTEGLRVKMVGSTGDAISLFEECIKIDPTRDGAYYQIAQIAYMMGNIPKAFEYGNEALARSKNIWHYMLVANSLYQIDMVETAIDVYEEARKLYPDNEELLFTLGNLYYETGRFQEAFSSFEYFDGKYGMAGNSAIPLIKSMIGLERFSEAEAKLRMLIELYPEDNIYLGVLAEMYRDKGDFEKASDIYASLIKENPEDLRILYSMIDFLKKGNNYNDLFSLLNGIILSEKIEADEKIKLFATLLDDKELVSGFGAELEMSLMLLEAAHKDVSVVFLLKPELFSLTGRKREAIESLESFVIRWPENYYAWEKLLLLYLSGSEYEKLYASSSSAVRRFNTAVLPRLLNAAACVEIAFYDEALEQLQKVRRLSNENEVLIIQILAIEADALYRKGLTEESFAKFKEALVLSPDDNTILNNYAYFLAEKGTRLNEAMKMIEQVMEKEPDNATFLDTYAWVLYKKGKYKKAEAAMLKIFDSGDSGEAVNYEHYGFILKSMNRCEEAVIAWHKAIELDDTKDELNEEIQKCIGGR